MRSISDIAEALRANAEAVCRHYLSEGRKVGNYWTVGNVLNERGGSLHVRLQGPLSGPNARGKWADEATGEYGDLLDLIRHQSGHDDIRAAADEARAFLSLPQAVSARSSSSVGANDTGADDEWRHASVISARKILRASRPIRGSLAETYLVSRSIHANGEHALRFHPTLYYRENGVHGQSPALIGKISNKEGTFTGINRIWLRRDGKGLAAIENPKKCLGHLRRNGVYFGRSSDLLVAGEGMETILSLKTVRPDIAMVAALTANHLAAINLPTDLKHLIIARDNDAAGLNAAEQLTERALMEGIRCNTIVSRSDDFNTDLTTYGPRYLKERLSRILVSLEG